MNWRLYKGNFYAVLNNTSLLTISERLTPFYEPIYVLKFSKITPNNINLYYCGGDLQEQQNKLLTDFFISWQKTTKVFRQVLHDKQNTLP